jgi:hypothetical protein
MQLLVSHLPNELALVSLYFSPFAYQTSRYTTAPSITTLSHISEEYMA